jgi:hypothetical protein
VQTLGLRTGTLSGVASSFAMLRSSHDLLRVRVRVRVRVRLWRCSVRLRLAQQPLPVQGEPKARA